MICHIVCIAYTWGAFTFHVSGILSLSKDTIHWKQLTGKLLATNTQQPSYANRVSLYNYMKMHKIWQKGGHGGGILHSLDDLEQRYW